MKYKFFYIGGFLLAFLILGQNVKAQLGTGFQFNVFNTLNVSTTEANLSDRLPTFNIPTSTEEDEADKLSEEELKKQQLLEQEKLEQEKLNAEKETVDITPIRRDTL